MKGTKKIPREPKLLRRARTGELMVNREWVGWFVLYKEYRTVDDILDIAANRAVAEAGMDSSLEAIISREGNAIVTFVKPEVI